MLADTHSAWAALRNAASSAAGSSFYGTAVMALNRTAEDGSGRPQPGKPGEGKVGRGEQPSDTVQSTITTGISYRNPAPVGREPARPKPARSAECGTKDSP